MKPFNNTPSLRANHPTPARGALTGKALVLFCEDQIRDYLYAIDCGYVQHENWNTVLANLRAELATAQAAAKNL
jgi:hypothetical protein